MVVVIFPDREFKIHETVSNIYEFAGGMDGLKYKGKFVTVFERRFWN
jgi:hypothetical protein